MNDQIYKVVCIKKQKFYEHRLMMERRIGRKLKKCEIVHHKNHDHKDNRIENLEIMTRSEHMKLHKTGEASPDFRHDVKTSDLIQDYRNGMALRAISRKYNLARTGIKTRLKRAGEWLTQR